MQGLGTFSPSAVLRLSTTRPKAGPDEGDRSDSQCCSAPCTATHTLSRTKSEITSVAGRRGLGMNEPPFRCLVQQVPFFPSSNLRRHCQAATRCDMLPFELNELYRPNDASWLSAFACCHKSPSLTLPDAPSQQTSRRRDVGQHPQAYFYGVSGSKSPTRCRSSCA